MYILRPYVWWGRVLVSGTWLSLLLRKVGLTERHLLLARGWWGWQGVVLSLASSGLCLYKGVCFGFGFVLTGGVPFLSAF